MRNFLTIAAPALSLLVTVGCSGAPGNLKDPPILKVTSPARSLVKSGAGQIMVTGTVGPNADGVPVATVLVNDVQAEVGPDGTFQASIEVKEGASFIQTIARDEEGGQASDTRAVHAGNVLPAGSNIASAVTVSMSADAFDKISAAAGPIIKGMDIAGMLAPMQPMQKSGPPSCLYEQVFVNDLKFSDIAIKLEPSAGGLNFFAQIDGLDVPGMANYAVACLGGSTGFRVTADRVVISGTLLVEPNGMKGFSTTLVNKTVDLTNFQFNATGIPGQIINMINMRSTIESILATGAELAMQPMLNAALGALAGPKQIEIMGKQMNIEVDPNDISFDVTGALVTMNMAMLIGGSEASTFIYTENGLPLMDPGKGFQLGLADDLANEMMSEAKSLGLLDLSMPTAGGTFDSTGIAMTLPPMISADPKDGHMRVVLGDMIATFMSGSTPMGKAAINASLDLKIETAANGYAVALKLGEPKIEFNILDDFENQTRLEPADLENASESALKAQIAGITQLLVNIPLPNVAGLQVRNLTIGSDSGYVMVNGALE
ncbi:MAG: hypothetical protein H6Q90_2255 [Deltaproteobacteria bacterium]|nr:hypothetical protein [Deltaproteobacteria bacterium]